MSRFIHITHTHLHIHTDILLRNKYIFTGFDTYYFAEVFQTKHIALICLPYISGTLLRHWAYSSKITRVNKLS